MNICKECGLEKTYEEMKKDKRSETGVSTICKACNNEWNKKLKNGETQRVRNTAAERENWPVGMKCCTNCKELLSVDSFGKHSATYDGLMGMCRECRRPYSAAHYDKWIKKNPTRRLWSAARHRASRANLPFDITPEDIIVPDVCPVFGIEFEVNTGEKAKYNSPSLDRFIPELGYVKSNIQVISFRANWIKQNATLQEVEALAKWMREKTVVK